MQSDITAIDLSYEYQGTGTDALGQPLTGGNGGDAGDLSAVPAMSVVHKFDNGVALSQGGSTARVTVPAPESRPQVNVIAEKKSTRPLGKNNVVMAGAHLDSVPAGPGINDNGSGSAALIEVAEQLARFSTPNTIRLAWWGAEEAGLIGSTQYVNGLSQEERDEIALYLNFDMIGSPNYVFMVYDGDESGFPAPPGVPIPAGSIQIEDTFESFYTWAGEPYDDAQFSGRSDYQAFILNDIPAGGLFTGAEGVKTAQQAAIWGGTAGQQYDPCYHLACDTYANNSDTVLDQNSDAIAHTMLYFSQRNFAKEPLVNPPTPVPGAGDTGGGGLHDDHEGVDR